MAGIYSQGGSAGHRYAGWLETVEAKNFTFGGKVFNGSPSAIYVGSNLVWAPWLLKDAAIRAIIAAFGQRDGMAVIKATNAYLNQLAASDMDKATALAGYINEDPMMVCSLGLEVEGVTMPIRWLVGDGTARIKTGIIPTANTGVRTIVKQTQDIMNGYVFSAGKREDRYAVYNQSNTIIYWYYPGSYASTGVSFGAIREIIYNVNGKFYIKDLAGNILFQRNLTQTSCVAQIQTGTSNYDYSYNTGKDDFQFFEIYEGESIVFNGVPCVHEGKSGLYDIESKTWKGNEAGSGAFAIAYTLQDGVTPWTPSTP